MPKLSDTMTEGTLVEWKVKVGDEIEIGQVIAEIQTDKATMEMEAFDEGSLVEINVNAGEAVPVGTVLGSLAEDGEEFTPGDTGSSINSSAATSSPSEETSAQATSAASAVPTQLAPDSSDGRRVKASPLAKKIAAATGVDLSTIIGTGPGGRITASDVENPTAATNTSVNDTAISAATSTVAAAATGLTGAAVAAASSASKPAAKSTPKASTPAQAPAPTKAAITPTVSAEDTVTPLSGMRKIIAERLLTSKQTIPHFYLHVEVDAGPLMALRKQVNSQAETSHGNKFTFNDFVVKAMINACLKVPAVNASFNGDSIVQFANVGVSIAIAVDDGLVTPVVKNAQTKSLLAISQEIKAMAVRARDNKLKPDEFDNGTITISNLGAWGIESFDAIVNPPQAAIISVGGIIEKAIVKDGEIVPGMRMNIGMSCDHRVVDGAVAATYLNEVKNLLEQPSLMLI